MFSLKTLTSLQGFRIIGQGIARLHVRFPFTLFCSLVGTCYGLYLLEYERDHDLRIGAIRLIFTFLLGVPLLFSAEMYEERQPKQRWYAVLLVLVLLEFYYYSNHVENIVFENPLFYIRTFTLLVVGHLCVSFIPYLRWGANDAFWQYNKTLFLAIFTAFLYSATLAGGLMLALGAINNLFELHIEGHRYAQVFIFVNGYVNTLLFLSNLKSLSEIDAENQYPTGLKYFTQYVLLPLVGIYVLILLAYETKIVATWALPRGWVSNLVLASGVFGILAFLLVHPLKHTYAWVAKFTRGYYLVLLPLVALMLVAIYTRIANYGITEPRFLVAILALWLLGMSIYFGVLNKQTIKIIPISLALVLVLSIYGPLSCFEVSVRNQKNRLEQALSTNALLNKNGKIIPKTTQKLSPEDTRKISASFDYLSTHNMEGLQSFFQKTDYENLVKANWWARRNMIEELTKIKIGDSEKADDSRYIYVAESDFLKVNKADYLIEINSDTKQSYEADGHTFGVALVGNTLQLHIDQETLMADLQAFTKLNEGETQAQALSTKAENEHWRAIIMFSNVSISAEDALHSYSGRVLLTKK